MSRKMRSNLLLLLTALIWGTAFVAQKAGAVLEPFTYNGIRMLIGGLVLIPVIMIFSRAGSSDGRGHAAKGAGEALSVKAPAGEALSGKTFAGKAPAGEALPAEKSAEEAPGHAWIPGGICCGIALAVASNLQQYGIYFDTDAGKAGFITALYIVFVPVIGLFVGKKVRPLVWFCVLLGATGFYLLTMAGKGSSLTLEKGDFFVLLCAVAFSIHILVIDHFAQTCDGIRLSCVQFLTCGAISLICMAIFDHPDIKAILDCWLPILYCGVVSCGVAYTLQVLGQQGAEPATATLIMSLESVFAVLAGALLLHERMSLLEVIGCLVIFAAVVLAQMPGKEEGRETEGPKSRRK